MERWVLVVLVLGAVGGLEAALESPCPDTDGADAIVAALVDVHGGVNCDQVKLRSLQKVAAAQVAAQHLNHEAKLKIGVHVMDTCGNKRKAVRQAFKSLVYADPTVCPKSPILLGYLGPEDPTSLAAVRQVTGVYNYVHLNPLAPTRDAAGNYMTKINDAQKVKAISSVLRQLRWSTFSVLHSEGGAALAAALGGVACVPMAHSLSAMPFAHVTTRGVMVIAPGEQLLSVVRANAALDLPHPLLLVALDAGAAPPLALLDDLQEGAVLLQMAPPRPIADLQRQLKKSYLWDEYLHQQRCNFSSCSVEDTEAAEVAAVAQDVSVTGVTQAMAAFGRALRVAHRARCGAHFEGRCSALDGILPEEWRALVAAEAPPSASSLPPHFDIFFKQAFAQGLLRVTNFSHVDFPESKGDDCRHLVEQPSSVGPKRVTTPIPHVEEHPDNEFKKKVTIPRPEDEIEIKFKPKLKTRDFFGDIESMSTMELVAIFVGFACSAGVALFSCIYCMYSIFKVKGDGEARSKHARSNSVSTISNN